MYKITIANGALDEHPTTVTEDTWYEVQDYITEYASKHGVDVSDDDAFTEFMTLVRVAQL